MPGPLLSIKASTPLDMLRMLRRVRMIVPHVGKRRTSQHRERYTMAYFLPTAYIHDYLDFPLTIEHRDNTATPDFLLQFPYAKIGVECVEAVPQEWYEIEHLRRKSYPRVDVVFMPRFCPDGRVYSAEQKHAIASGQYAGPPWVGNAPERQWAEAMKYFIADKVSKLRRGNYAPLNRLWLLVQDEWRVPIAGIDNRIQAFDMLASGVGSLLNAPSFEAVFILSSPALFILTASRAEVLPLEDIWNLC